MKLDFNRKYNTIAVYAVLVIAAGAAIVLGMAKINMVAAFVGKALSILSPFFWGFGIAYILCPLMNAYERGLFRLSKGKLLAKPKRTLAILLTYLTALAALVIFFSIVIPQIGQSIMSLANQIPDWLKKLQTVALEIVNRYNLENLPASTINKLVSTAENWLEQLTSQITTMLPQIFHATMSVTTSVVNVIIGCIISLYLLADKERFFAHVRKIFSAVFSQQRVDHLTRVTRKSHEVFSGFIVGKLLDSLIIGLLCLLFMSIMRWPYAMLISVIVGVTNIIPYFGPFFGAIPSILILLIADPVTAFWFALFVLVLQQLDGNVIGPKILGDSTGLSPFWVIFSITVFGSLMGVLGMFIGVPLFAVIYYLISELVSNRLAKKAMPVATAEYAPPDHPIIQKPPKKHRDFRNMLNRFRPKK